MGEIELVPGNAIALAEFAGSEKFQQCMTEGRCRQPLHQAVGTKVILRNGQKAALRLRQDFLDASDRFIVRVEDLTTQQQLGVDLPDHDHPPGMRLMTLSRSQSCQSNTGVSLTSSASSISTPISVTFRHDTR